MDFTKSPRIECPLWDKLQAEEESERRRAFHVNNFDRMISLTEEGKLWKFPINNDQGWTEEEDVSFGEHVFLDPLIEDFPKKGPVRHFMELVTAGLSKNPHMTVKEKHDHINWYRTYFIENQDLMREELGEEHGTIREPHQPV
ncbi:28S ribosomal protein S31, mitochondrial-like [Mizuhopecten yessoensis]|uniref:28S ribosomal protein S31, mitochondrial-like n=1 Tax=Mizuhopecten yessoensis TaxID=6573 RepID=UPI000B45CC79|nr:28S ribosomal protein S31, mitochondrial-like [Mizuhopecten yessoensis]